MITWTVLISVTTELVEIKSEYIHVCVYTRSSHPEEK